MLGQDGRENETVITRSNNDGLIRGEGRHEDIGALKQERYVQLRAFIYMKTSFRLKGQGSVSGRATSSRYLVLTAVNKLQAEISPRNHNHWL